MKESITFESENGKQHHLEIDHLHSNILTGGSPGRIKKVADYLDDSETFTGSRGHTIVNGSYEDIKVSAFPTGMGPASVGITLPEAFEEADHPITILRLGTSAGLQKFMEAGDIAVSTGAIRDEKTTRSIVGPEFPATADPQLIPCILAAAEKYGYELGENLWTGPTHTKSNLYFDQYSPLNSPIAESMEEKFQSYRKMGAIASAMEFSVYSIFRDYYENMMDSGIISVGCLLAIMARLEEDYEYVRGTVDKDRMERDMIQIGLETLVIADKIRNEKDLEVDLTEILRKMMNLPTNTELKSNQE